MNRMNETPESHPIMAASIGVRMGLIEPTDAICEIVRPYVPSDVPWEEAIQCLDGLEFDSREVVVMASGKQHVLPDRLVPFAYFILKSAEEGGMRVSYAAGKTSNN